MQLEDRSNLRAALAAASCGLVGMAAPSVNAGGADPLQVDSALLYYAEKDRVKVSEAAGIFTQPLGENESVTVAPTVDAITGASPTGAIPTNKPQTFGADVTPAGTLPLKTFSDRRYAIALSWEQPMDRFTKSVLGASGSTEKDYMSLGLSASVARDFNNKLTTLSAGLSGNLDTVQPGGVISQGLTPLGTSANATTAAPPSSNPFEDALTTAIPHAVTSASGVVTGGGAVAAGGGGSTRQSRNKQLVDGMIGLTQVINRRTLMQLNYSLGTSSGYLTDPYKIISLIDGTTGETTGYITERRPDQRLRQSAYWKTVYHLGEDVIHFSYRYYWDDWGIRSHTVDLHYRFELGHDFYLEPQVRYYSQTAADFYRFSLVDGAPLPSYASADYRLAEMSSYTYGLKFAMPTGKDGELSVRAMYMQQTGNSHPAGAIGVERNQNLYPGLEAVTFQIGYSFKF